DHHELVVTQDHVAGMEVAMTERASVRQRVERRARGATLANGKPYRSIDSHGKALAQGPEAGRVTPLHVGLEISELMGEARGLARRRKDQVEHARAIDALEDDAVPSPDVDDIDD